MRRGFSLTYREHFAQLFRGLGIVCNLWFSLLRNGVYIQLASAFRGPSGCQLRQNGVLGFTLLWLAHGEHLAPRFRCIIVTFGSPVREESRKVDFLAATIYVLINIEIADKVLTERAFDHCVGAFHGDEISKGIEIIIERYLRYHSNELAVDQRTVN